MPTSTEKPIVVAIVGPTASGKTGLSLAIAEELNAEIVACDSRTVYRYFDIGTAKPDATERARIPHHLIDVVDPTGHFTVAEFTELGSQAIADIASRGKLPIVCGGTGFYARALLEGLALPDVSPNAVLRASFHAIADREGNEALWRKLDQVDAPAAAKLGVNDRFRIIRALEVIEMTGIPFSEAAKRVEPPYRVIWIGTTADDRAKLHEQIRTRFAQQVEAGIVEETERLYAQYGRDSKLLNTVNYKQLMQHVEGKLDRKAAIEEAIIANNQLARRQLMWFRANSQIEWFAFDRLEKDALHVAAATHIKEGIRRAASQATFD